MLYQIYLSDYLRNLKLSAKDFCDVVKAKVLQRKPHTLNERKVFISQAFIDIDPKQNAGHSVG